MNNTEEVLAIVEDITGSDLHDKLDVDIFETGILDSLATIELLVSMQEKFDVDIPISEFDRNDWNTVNKIVAKLESLK